MEVNSAITPGELYDAEEQIRQWHARSLQPGPGQGATYSKSGRRRGLVAAIRRRLQTSAGHGDGGSEAAISTRSVLDAVARGELTPRAAQRLLEGRLSTLALLQSVAWGEISPQAAQHLLV